jgi:hypothetical protein
MNRIRWTLQEVVVGLWSSTKPAKGIVTILKNVLGSILEEKIDKQAKSRARCIRFTRLCKSTVRTIIETMMTAIGTRNPNISLSFWTPVEKIKAYS